MLKAFLQGRFMGHPLHPAIVHLPIGFWVASLILDTIYLTRGNVGFALSSYYCIGMGLITIILAAPTGLAEYLSIPAHTRPKRLGTLHLNLNLIITILYIINFLYRRSTGRLSVTSGEYVLAWVSVVLLMISGYLGGVMVYQYGIGHRIRSKDVIPSDTRRAA